MGLTFLMLSGMFACKGPNSGGTEPEKVKVTYDVEGGHGSIKAELKGKALPAKSAEVEKASSVVFTATPEAGYEVKEWKKDGTTVAGQKGTTYTLSKIEKNVDVKVVFEKSGLAVNYSVNPAGKAKIAATVDGKPITSGEKVEKNKTVVFTVSDVAEDHETVWTMTGVAPTKVPAKGVLTASIKVEQAINAVVNIVEKEGFAVNFSVEPADKAKIAATVDGKPITSGKKVPTGKKVTFTVSDVAEGYQTVWTGLPPMMTPAKGALTANVDVDKEYNVVVKLEKTTEKFTVTYKVDPAAEGSLTVTEGANSVSSGDEVEKDKTVNFVLAINKANWEVKEWSEGLTVATDKMSATVVVTKNIDVTVTLQEKPVEKKDAEITYVSINGDKWDATKKKIVLLNPLTEDISKTNVNLKARSTDGTIAEDTVPTFSVTAKAATDKLQPAAGETTHLVIKSEATATLKEAEVEVEVYVFNPISKVTFTPAVATPTSKDAENKVQEVKFTVQHDEFDMKDGETRCIDAIIEGDKDFPVGSKFEVKCHATPKTGAAYDWNGTYEVKTTPAKTIFGSQAVTAGGAINHTRLVKEHVGLKEEYTVTITLPETQTEAIKVKNTSALFANATATTGKTLGKVEFTLQGVKAYTGPKEVKFEPATTVTSKAGTGNQTQTIVITAKYEDNFEVLANKFIGSYIARKDGKDFPVGAKIKLDYDLTLKGGTTYPTQHSDEYTVPASKKKIYGYEIFSDKTKPQIKHVPLSAEHVGAKEVFTITITLPATVTEDIVVENHSLLFDATDATEGKELGKTEFTIKAVKTLKENDVTFTEPEVKHEQNEPAKRTVKFDVQYPADFCAETGDYIDAVLTLGDGTKDFPQGTVIKLTYKLNGSALPEQTYTVPASTKKIFGHKLFNVPTTVERTKLNKNHVGAKETYEITVTFPETASDDVYALNVVSGLFADATTEDVKVKLGEKTINVIGHELSKLTYADTEACKNLDAPTNRKKEFTYTITYPQFAMPDPKQFIDAILTLEGGKKFPKDTEITVTFNGTALPVYNVAEVAGADKLFGSLIAGQTTRSGLNADLKGATQTFKITIELPSTATEATYNLVIQTAAFEKDKVTENPEPIRTIGEAHKITISGYGH